MGALSPKELRRVYDRIGRWQDTQSFYERAAALELLAHAELGAATAVCELGCGTGRLAAQLLERHLPAGCRYRGIDLSPVMVRLAARRLQPWSGRASVEVVDGMQPWPVADGEFSHVITAYVLDLMDSEAAARAVAEAWRVLRPGGRLCAVSSTAGVTPASRLVMAAWMRLWSRWPKLAGGCRPIALLPLLAAERWHVAHRSVVSSWGISSEVVVARRRG